MKHEVDVHVGTRIRHRRWLIGMTQQQLAEKTGISQSDISKFETGGGNPSIKTLQRLAAGMGMILQVEFKPVTSAH